MLLLLLEHSFLSCFIWLTLMHLSELSSRSLILLWSFKSKVLILSSNSSHLGKSHTCNFTVRNDLNIYSPQYNIIPARAETTYILVHHYISWDEHSPWINKYLIKEKKKRKGGNKGGKSQEIIKVISIVKTKRFSKI